MIKIKIIALFLVMASGAFAQSEEAIAVAIKSGDSKEIAKYFGQNISLKIIDKENVYSKTQAEMIVKDFFARNQPQAYVAKHQGTSRNGAKYTIGLLTTATGNYRTYYFIKKTGDALLIQELRIEKE